MVEWTIDRWIAIAGFVLAAVVAALTLLRHPHFISSARGAELVQTISDLRAEVMDLRAKLKSCQIQLVESRDQIRYLERHLRALEDRQPKGR